MVLLFYYNDLVKLVFVLVVVMSGRISSYDDIVMIT